MRNILNFDKFLNEYKVNKQNLYHTTSLNGLCDILSENILKKSYIFDNVSFTRNKGYWYRNRSIRLVLDRELLSKNYKLISHDFYNDKNKLDNGNIYGTQKEYLPKSALGVGKDGRKAPFEYEEYVEKDIKNISKYLVAIEIKGDVLENPNSKKYLDFIDEYIIKYPYIKLKIVDGNDSDYFNRVSYIKESTTNNFHTLFGELVYIDDIKRWGDEIKVEYTKSDGTQHTYIGDDKDFREDFIESSDSFDFNPKTTNVVKKPIKKMKYDIVFYIGNKKMKIVRNGIENQKLAYSLKNTFKKYPEYKMGRLEVESYETY